MSNFRERTVLLTSPEDVTGFLEQFPTSVIFKAGTCHKTMQGFGFVQDELKDRDDMMVGIIRVVEARPASNLVAEQTGIIHHSPQFILFKEGQAVFERNNWDITAESVAEGLGHVPYSGEGVSVEAANAVSDLRPYLQLLEQFLSNSIDERQFEYSYTMTFRDDSSLRSSEEVDILGSIFGDVDRHLEMHRMMGGRSDLSGVRERAQAAYDRLQQLS